MMKFILLQEFIAPRTAMLTAALMLAVPIMLWYQSSRREMKPENAITCYNLDHSNDDLARTALDPRKPNCDRSLLEYVGKLKKSGYAAAALTWLKFGAERGTSAEVMREYAAALERTDPAMAAEWRKRAASLSPKTRTGGKS